MAEFCDPLTTIRCCCCLSRSQDISLCSYVIKNERMQQIFQKDRLTLCYLCERAAILTDEFIGNVEANQKLLEDVAKNSPWVYMHFQPMTKPFYNLACTEKMIMSLDGFSGDEYSEGISDAQTDRTDPNVKQEFGSVNNSVDLTSSKTVPEVKEFEIRVLLTDICGDTQGNTLSNSRVKENQNNENTEKSEKQKEEETNEDITEENKIEEVKEEVCTNMIDDGDEIDKTAVEEKPGDEESIFVPLPHTYIPDPLSTANFDDKKYDISDEITTNIDDERTINIDEDITYEESTDVKLLKNIEEDYCAVENTDASVEKRRQAAIRRKEEKHYRRGNKSRLRLSTKRKQCISIQLSKSTQQNKKRADGDAKFICNDCGKEYSTKIQIIRHMKKAHGPRKKSFICDYCRKRYTDKDKFIRHVTSHHEVIPSTKNVFKSKNITVKERALIVRLHDKGLNITDIVAYTGYNRKTVSRWIKPSRTYIYYVTRDVITD